MIFFATLSLILIGFYLLTPAILLFLYYLKPSDQKQLSISKNYNFGVIITAHQDTRFISPLVDSLLKQKYNNFKIYVVADDCDISKISFDNSKVKILRPKQALNAKIKSIDYAINNFDVNHDAIVIYDSDNLVHQDSLKEINRYFSLGYKAVQSHLKPKNQNTDFAILDSIGDVFHNFLDRKARMKLGLSSHIFGLGIAMDIDLYKKIIYQSHLGGFDKKIQADIILNGEKIAFAQKAYVYDEKIKDGQALRRQRTRWINSYFKYFKNTLQVLGYGFRTLNFDAISFGINLLRPPLFLLVFSGLVLTITSYFINISLFYIWCTILTLFFISFILIVSEDLTEKKWTRLFKIPLFAFYLFQAFFKINRANKSFLKTEHHEIVFIDDLNESKS